MMNTQTSTKEIKRTEAQNRALHLYFEQLAKALNENGLDMRIVLKPSVSISWTKQNIKEYLWKPLMKALINKESTTELGKLKQIDLVYDNLNRHLVEKFGEVCEFPQFPSLEEISFNKIYGTANKTK